MTKVTVFGEQESKAEKKPIELVWFLDSKGFRDNPVKPSMYDNIVLLGKDCHEQYDLIMTWDDDYSWRNIYLGHWNDGVV